MYPMMVERSNARATSKNPWLTQPCRQFPHAARLNSTPSGRLPERRPHTSPSPVKVQSGFTGEGTGSGLIALLAGLCEEKRGNRAMDDL